MSLPWGLSGRTTETGREPRQDLRVREGEFAEPIRQSSPTPSHQAAFARRRRGKAIGVIGMVQDVAHVEHHPHPSAAQQGAAGDASDAGEVSLKGTDQDHLLADEFVDGKSAALARRAGDHEKMLLLILAVGGSPLSQPARRQRPGTGNRSLRPRRRRRFG